MGVIRTHTVCEGVTTPPSEAYTFSPIGKKMYLRVYSTYASNNVASIAVYANVGDEINSTCTIAGRDYSAPTTYIDPIVKGGIYIFDTNGFSSIKVEINSIAAGSLTVKIAEF